jgi:hypothetical protein
MWKRMYPAGSSAAEITRYNKNIHINVTEHDKNVCMSRHSLDGTYRLTNFISNLERIYGDQVSSSMSDRSHSQEQPPGMTPLYVTLRPIS